MFLALAKLIEQWHGPTNLAKKLGYSGPSYLSQLISSNRPLTEKTARQIEARLSLPAGWLDLDHTQEKAPEISAALVTETVLAVGAALEAEGLQIPPARFADLVAIAYENAAATGSVDPAFVRRIVKLLTQNR